LADKYGAAGAIVAVASPGGGGISVGLAEVRPLGAPWEGRAGGQGASRDDALAAAVADATRAVEEGWKQRNMLRFGEGGKLMALIPVSSLNEWMSVKNRLTQVPVVERVELQALSRNLVQVVVTFAGDEAQLQFALNQRELSLSKDGDTWMLRAVTPPAPPSPPEAQPEQSPASPPATAGE
ncbi:MAG: hypothetical protein JNK21_14805, partial [Rhodospirillaceae bacterium]|nr:hypothetical protein [Rhodospirillaceae bacterium]